MNKSTYANLGDIILDCAAIFQPPERMTVSEAARKYITLHNPPAYVGKYQSDTTPYMDEPMDEYASRRQNGLVFVGPAQCAKTQGLLLNTVGYTIKCNPADIILYSPTQAAARDFSKRRIDRMHRHSPDVGEQLVPGQHSDNTFDKFYKSGMMLTLSWPSVTEMAGKPVPITLLTDYDRMPMNVDGEGSPYALAQKRTTTFGSFSMTVAESSPSKDITDARWKPSPQRPHEAPPCEGILALYNSGDRRRWHWPCPHCGEFFEGSFSDLHWDDNPDPSAAAATVYMMCPHNGCVIRPDSRYWMNTRGKWVKEGQRVVRGAELGSGTIEGEGLHTKAASFWLKGPAAAFTTWEELVSKYLIAENEYRNTGSQEALKVTVNTDQGEPYLPRGMEGDLVAEELQNCAVSLPERKVPADVRALVATCDVQKNSWKVQVFGIMPGAPFELSVVDRFEILKSNRTDEDGERLWVRPADHPEDWDLLITEVMERRYDLADDRGTMGISLTLCDSGGKEGVTNNAYLFYGRLRKKGLTSRFLLVKGASSKNAPRIEVSYPDSQRKDRLAHARGEVPVLMLNTDILKDYVHGMLPKVEYTQEGEVRTGRIRFPNWLPESFYEEYTVEVRTAKGWINKANRRNESLDLTVYAVAGCLHRGLERVNWTSVVPWLAPWESNEMVAWKAAAGAPVAPAPRTLYGRAQLGEALG